MLKICVYLSVCEMVVGIDRLIYQILELGPEIWKFEKKVVPLQPISKLE